MSQNNYTIGNQTTPSFRADLNSALQALASNSSGTTEPDTTYANMLWYDTAANILKMRSEADDAWIRIGVLNQSTSKFEVEDYLGFTPVQQGGGAGQVSSNKVYIGWTGTELKAQVDTYDQGAIAFKSDIPAGIGVGQTWQAVSRSANVWYQNTTGRSIVFQMRTNATGNLDILVGPSTSVFSTQGWGDLSSGTYDAACVIIPPNHYYRAGGGGMSITSAQELR
jgi:hypothetical protein